MELKFNMHEFNEKKPELITNGVSYESEDNNGNKIIYSEKLSGRLLLSLDGYIFFGYYSEIRADDGTVTCSEFEIEDTDIYCYERHDDRTIATNTVEHAFWCNVISGQHYKNRKTDLS